MAARKCREDQFAAIGVALMDGQLVAKLDGLDNPIYVGEIKLWVQSLSVHVERHCHEAAIARPLAIAKQAAFDPVSACHQPELGGGYSGSAIIVGVQADHSALAIGQIANEIFDLIGINIGP